MFFTQIAKADITGIRAIFLHFKNSQKKLIQFRIKLLLQPTQLENGGNFVLKGKKQLRYFKIFLPRKISQNKWH